MTASSDSLEALVERIRQNEPEILNLATAETEEQFNASFIRVLERALNHLEKNARNFSQLDEVALSGVLAGCFLGYGLTMVQEGHSNGHVDLIVEVRLAFPVQRRLAEAKIEDGPVYHEKGLRQLLERYLTGRESTGWLIGYVKSANIKGRFETLRKDLDERKPLGQVGNCQDHILKWAFISDHKHTASGETIRIEHVGCNLYH